MVLLMISGCRNADILAMDKYVNYACSNNKLVISMFTGLGIFMIFYKNIRRKSEAKKLKDKRKRAKMS
jgi:hypothetical protein